MSLEVLKQVHEVEAEASGIIEAARRKMSERIAEASQSAVAEVEQARSAATLQVKKAVETATREADEEIKRLRNDHQGKRDRIRAGGMKKMDAAMSLIIERFLG